LGLLALPAAAQDTATEGELGGGEVDASDYPELELIVSLPAGLSTGDEAEFRITEDGREITPEVARLSSSDLDVVLAIDTSGSMSGGALDAARSAAIAFATELPSSARIGLVGFGPEPLVATPLTTDREALALALIGLVARGETALYDAVTTASEQIDTATESRTALVILSDGGDTVSLGELEDAAAAAAGAFDVVHAVALSSTEQDAETLASLVSGGGSVVQAADPVALASVYTDLAGRITNQYTLRWESDLEADTPVQIVFSAGTTELSIERLVDVNEGLIARLAAQAAAEAAAAATTLPPPTTTVVFNTELPIVAARSTMADWVLWLGLGLVAAGLFSAGIVMMLPAERRRNLADDLRDRMPRGRQLSGVGQRLVHAVEEFLRREPDRQVGLALRIERAGLELAPAEFGAAVVAGAAILMLVGFGVFGFFGLVLLPVLGVSGALFWLDRKGNKRSAAFTAQLDATLQLMSGSLRSGFGIMQALGTVAEEAESPTCDEFSRILGEVRLGRDLGDAMRASSTRINTPDYDWAIQAIDISREVGGNLAEVLDNVSQTIRQRNTLRRQVVSLSAEGRVSGVILVSLPIVLMLWMSVSNRPDRAHRRRPHASRRRGLDAQDRKNSVLRRNWCLSTSTSQQSLSGSRCL
jgi:tight adherence protein B